MSDWIKKIVSDADRRDTALAAKNAAAQEAKSNFTRQIDTFWERVREDLSRDINYFNKEVGHHKAVEITTSDSGTFAVQRSGVGSLRVVLNRNAQSLELSSELPTATQRHNHLTLRLDALPYEILITGRDEVQIQRADIAEMILSPFLSAIA